MGFLGSLTVIGFAIFPAAVLTGFLISHFRRRLGWRLAIRAIVLGAIASLLVIALYVIMGPPQRWFPPGPIRIVVQAFLGTALPEEGAKFLLLYYVIREHKDCDSGGDLFSAAMLIALGFAGLENVFYVLGGGEAWLSLAMMRGVLAIPGHAIFGCMMGYFAARAFRGSSPRLNWPLAFLVAFAAHGAYDLPLMAWDHLGVWPADRQEAIWYRMFWLLVGTLAISGFFAILFCRRELVEIFAAEGQDEDVHLPARWAVRPWRWLGNLMIVASLLAAGLGAWLLAHQRIEGAFLVLPSIFPQTFGWIMRLRPPAMSIAAAHSRIRER